MTNYPVHKKVQRTHNVSTNIEKDFCLISNQGIQTKSEHTGFKFLDIIFSSVIIFNRINGVKYKN